MSIGAAYLLPGATRLDGKDTGFFETYRGIIETPAGKVRAYVKLLGPKALTNEVLCTLLGQAVGLPIPDGYLVEVSAKDYPDSPFLSGQRLAATLAYGSATADAPALARQYNVSNDDDENAAFDALLPVWSGWQQAMIFDAWVANGDRHSGNILIGAANKVWLIDHTHAFTGPSWYFTNLRPTAYTKNHIAIHAQRRLSPREKYALRRVIGTTASRYKEVPAADLIDGSKVVQNLLSSEDIEALKTFVGERIDKLPSLLSEPIGMPSLFPVS